MNFIFRYSIRKMLTCVTEIGMTFRATYIYYIYFLLINIGLGTCLRRNDFVPLLNDQTGTEPGFDIDEDDMIKFHIWSAGTIPYYIDDFSFDKVLRDRIRMFLDGVNRLTGLHFIEIPKPPEDDNARWVLFLNRKGLLGCADHAFNSFTTKGIQKVVLGYHCMNSDENMADIVLSLVGVPPQHNAPNRDDSVNILKNNILPDKLFLFKKLKDTEWMFHNLIYDIESAGHYGPYKHTSNGKITIQPKLRDPDFTPPRGHPSKHKENGFSLQDLLKIEMIYNYLLLNQGTPMPECSKLFVPPLGSSKSIIFQPQNKVKPRKKPMKYLGESKTQEVFPKEDTDNENESGDKNISVNSENNMEGNKNGEKVLGSDESKNNIEYDREYYKDNNEDDKEEIKYDDKENDENLTSNAPASEDNDDEKLSDNENEEIGKVIEDEKAVTAEERERSAENNESIKTTTTLVDTINTTEKSDREPLSHKSKNIKKEKLLGQSDYETGDEAGNKYVHEKNL